jgi:hypothetical protein
MFVLALFPQGFQHRSTCVHVSRTTNRHWRCLRWLSSFKKIKLDPVISSSPAFENFENSNLSCQMSYFFLETPKVHRIMGYVLCSRICKTQQQDNIYLLLARSIENGETSESCSRPLCAPPRNTVRSAICVSLCLKITSPKPMWTCSLSSLFSKSRRDYQLCLLLQNPQLKNECAALLARSSQSS